MVQTTSFFTNQPAPSIPRNRVIEALIEQGLTRQRDATTPLQGIANLAETTLATVVAKREEAKENERRTNFQNTIAAAIAAGADRQIDVPYPRLLPRRFQGAARLFLTCWPRTRIRHCRR